MPEQVLLSGLAEDTARSLVQALVLAFGPVGATPPGKLDPEHKAALVKLEQDLWGVVPPRVERRLKELCADVAAFDYDRALVGLKRAMRRAGLFACGDLPTAVRMASVELGLDPELPFQSQDGLERACAAHPELADLVNLATSNEYAMARWQPGAARPRPGSISGAGPLSRRR